MLLPALSLPIAGSLLAFVAHGAVAALLLRPGHGRQLARAVGLACAFTSVGALTTALSQSGVLEWDRVPVLIDTLRVAAWLNVLRVIARSSAITLVRVAWGACAAVALMILLVSAPELGTVLRAGGLLVTVLSLAVLVLLWLGAGTAPRQTLAPLLSGIGVPLAFEFTLQAFDLRSSGGVGWHAALQAVSLPLVLVGIRRVSATAPMAFVSRQVVLFTLALVAAAIYVALTALAAEAIAAADDSPSQWHETAFLAAAAVLFGVICAAPSVRRRMGVFVATHFYRNKYDYRVEWLRFIQTLSSGSASAAPSTAILAVAQMFGCSAGVLYARDEVTGRFERRACWPEQLSAGELPETMAADDALVRFLGERQWVIDMAELARDPRSHAGLDPPAWLARGERWGIVTPLLQLDALVGFIVLATPPPPFRISFEDRDLFKTVGRHIALLLTQQNAERRLAESRQFDAYNRFAAFVMHDLKNSVAQLQLVVQNAARHRHNPQFIDDAISTTANSVERMTGLIAQLQARDVHGHVGDVALTPLVEAAARRARERAPAPAFTGDGGTPVVRADAEKLGAVLDHVIRNAQEATGETGEVRIELESGAGRARLVVRDDGPGMDEKFVRESLFRPFHTTKGSKGMGIGAYQAREYVHSLGGSVEVQSSPGRGTAFCITLPLCQTPNPDSPSPDS